MNVATQVVLIAAGVTTLWLVYYVQIFLPRQLEQRVLESMKAFSRAVELRFPMSSGRTEEIIDYAAKIGKRFGYSPSELHELELTAYLRDIGCCAIPYRPFNEKDRADWSEAEWKVYNRHPEISGAMLELIPSLRHVADSVRWHHARFDGLDMVGSPVGVNLPLNARILKVASDYAWLTFEIGEGAAVKTIEQGNGTEYCPDVVSEFFQMLTSSGVKEHKPSLVGF